MFRIVSIFFILINFAHCCCASEIQLVSMPREDGTVIEGYFSPPENTSYPIFILIHGSQHESYYSVFCEIIKHINPHGIAVLTLEKQGFRKDSVDIEEYHKTNCQQRRIDDHFIVIDMIRSGYFPDWNGELILLGASEGGMIATKITPKIPEVKALLLFCTGGGITAREEVLLSARKFFSQSGLWGFELEHELAWLDNLLEYFIQNPDSGSTFLDFTYKWWSGHLSGPRLVDSMLEIECPILYNHGTLDDIIPVESADLLFDEFIQSGKTNLQYNRLEGIDHYMKADEVKLFGNALQWALQYVTVEGVD